METALPLIAVLALWWVLQAWLLVVTKTLVRPARG